ncbi:MAG: TRSP domain-containing protein, partial [Ruminococcus sp.]
DEISTGKTLINIINNFRERFPELNQKEIICASIINRVSPENMQNLENNNIKCEYLLKLPDEDYESRVRNIKVSEAVKLIDTPVQNCPIINISPVPNSRKGVNIREYYSCCLKASEEIIQKTGNLSGNTLVLGTEEFMYPALILGKKIGKNAFCHATTRSPIGICSDKNYPIQEGFKIPSFYDVHRETYIYNLKKYTNVIIFTDSKDIPQKSLNTLINVLKKHECENIFLVRG